MSRVTETSGPAELAAASSVGESTRALCSASTRAGQPCRNRAAEGSAFCHLHDPRVQLRRSSQRRPKPYASHAHEAKPDEAVAAVIEVTTAFPHGPSVLKNLVRDLVLTAKAREIWKGQSFRAQFDGITETYVKFREILANLSVSCAGCGVDFRLSCDAGFEDSILAARRKTWPLEQCAECPFCASKRIRIAVRNNDMLIPRMDLADRLILTAGLLATGVAFYFLWSETALGLPVRLLLSLLVASGFFLASFWVIDSHDRHRLRRRPLRPEEDPQALYPPVPIGGDSSPLAAARGITQQVRSPRRSVASNAISCDRCGRPIAPTSAIEVGNYKVCEACNRALDLEVLRDAGLGRRFP